MKWNRVHDRVNGRYWYEGRAWGNGYELVVVVRSYRDRYRWYCLQIDNGRRWAAYAKLLNWSGVARARMMYRGLLSAAEARERAEGFARELQGMPREGDSRR